MKVNICVHMLAELGRTGAGRGQEQWRKEVKSSPVLAGFPNRDMVRLEATTEVEERKVL